MRKTMLILVSVICAPLLGALAEDNCAVGESMAFDLNLRGADSAWPEGATVHYGGAMTNDEAWTAGSAHVVYGTVVVATNVTLTIEPGAIVKFIGGGLYAAGTCVANGVTFTDILDGMNGDYGATSLPMPSYVLKGNIETDDATRIRFAKNGDEFAATGESGVFTLNLRTDVVIPDGVFEHDGGTLAVDERWDAGSVHVVYGTLIVPDGVTLTIEPGAIVKFVGGGLDVAGTCIANGVTFTDIADGVSGCLAMPSYVLQGNIEVDDATRIKFAKTGDAFAAAGDSGPFLIETKEYAMRFAHEKEMLRYGAWWADGNDVSVVEKGTTGGERTVVYGGRDAGGSVEWTRPSVVGRYELRHVSGSDTLTATFAVLSGAIVHDGFIETNETWTADVVHAVSGDITVMAGVTLTIESGAIVKFNDGTVLRIAAGGNCIAEGVVFTHVADDTIGGDTMGDGSATIPMEHGYAVIGSVQDSVDTEYRYGTSTQSGTVVADTTWRESKTYVVDGRLTVATNATLTIPAGTVVKFTKGSSLVVEQGGTCIAEGVIFTHIADDSVGGDTMGDGNGTLPEHGVYNVASAVIDNDETEYRYSAPITISGTISTDKTWRARQVYHVTGNLTVASGATLTIYPGAVVKLNDKVKITVKDGGTLNALGTRSSQVVITSVRDDEYGGDTNGDGDATAPNGGYWDEIANYGTLNLAYTRVRCGGYGQYDNQGDASIFNYGGTTTLNGCVVEKSGLRLLNRSGGTMVAYNTVLHDGNWGWNGAVKFVNGIVSYCKYGSQSGTAINTIYIDCSNTAASGTTLKNCLAFSCGGGTSGMTVADPLFKDAANEDWRVEKSSPCVDAGLATDAPTADYYGQLRNGNPDIGLYEVQVRPTKSDYDLAAVSVSGDANATIGQNMTVTWTVENVGSADITSPWHDSLSLIDASGAIVELTPRANAKGLVSGGRYTNSKKFTVPAVTPGPARLRLKANANRGEVEEGIQTDNNVIVSEAKVNVSLPSVADGHHSRVSLSAGGSIALGIPAGSGVTAIRLRGADEISAFAAAGYMPISLKHDVSAKPLSDGSMLLSLPMEAATNDFMMAIQNDGANVAMITLETLTDEVAVLDVYPQRLSNATTGYMTLIGVGLDRVTGLNLEGTANIPASGVQKVSPGEMTATVALEGAATGTYSILLGTDDNSSVRASSVTVYSPRTGPILDARLDIPGTVRQGRIYTGKIIYSNVGDAEMLAPYFVVVASDAGLRLPGEEDWQTEPLRMLGIASSYPAGIIYPGESAELEFEFRSGSSPRFRLEVDDDDSEEWAVEKAELSETATRQNRLGRPVVRSDSLEHTEHTASDVMDHAVSGMFCDMADGSPLSGVTVMAVTLDGLALASDIVDDNGRFILTGLPADTNLVLTVQNGAFADNLAITMPETGDLLDVVWAGTKGYGIDIEVKGAEAEDFKNGIEVSVSLYGGNESYLIYLTNAVGNVRVKSEGMYLLKGEMRDGYEITTLAACQTGENVWNAVLDFDQGATVSGTVKDQGGNPVPNAIISLRVKNNVSASRKATADENGAFVLGCVNEGTYTLEASALGYASDVPIDVAVGGANVNGLALVLQRYGNSLSGSVPLSYTNGSVMVVFKSGVVSPTAVVNQDGTFAIDGLASGMADVQVYDGTGKLAEVRHDVNIVSGQNTMTFATTSPKCLFAGKAVDENGNALQSVWTFMDNSSDGAVVASGDSGYAVTELRKESYWYRVQAPGYLNYNGYVTVSTNYEATVRLQKGGFASVKIPAGIEDAVTAATFVSGGSTASGTKDALGAYVCGAYAAGTNVYAFVSCTNGAYYTAATTIEAGMTGECARVSANLPLRVTVTPTNGVSMVCLRHKDGSGIVSVYDFVGGVLALDDYPEIDLQIQATTAGGVVLATLDVAASERNVVLTSESVEVITGSLSGDKAPNGTISFYDADGTLRNSTTISACGTFRVDSLPAGVSLVRIELKDGTVFEMPREDAVAAGWDLAVPAGLGEASYTATDGNGTPIIGLSVQFKESSGRSVTVKTDSSGVARTFQKIGTALTVIVPPYATGEELLEQQVTVAAKASLNSARLLSSKAKASARLKISPNNNQVVVIIVDQEKLPDFYKDLNDCPYVDLADWKYWDTGRDHFWSNGGWIKDFFDKYDECQKRISEATKDPPPKFVTCIQKNCTYNERLWKRYQEQYTICMMELDIAIEDYRIIERDIMRVKQVFGSGLVIAVGAILYSLPEIAAASIAGSSITGATMAWMLPVGTIISGVYNGVDNWLSAVKLEVDSSSLVITSLMSFMAKEAVYEGNALFYIPPAVGGFLGVISEAIEYANLRAKMDAKISILEQDLSRLNHAIDALENIANTPYKECSPTDPQRRVVNNGGGDEIHPYIPPTFDPNEVAGPLGVGEQRYVKPGQEMEYFVYFENSKDVDGTVLDIRVTNPLSEWLDWSTFKMGEMAFNNQIDHSLEGLQNGSKEVPQNGTSYFVVNSVALDKANGVVTVELHILDKTTKYGQPEDPYAGILPPNDETGRGEGHFSYKINVRDDAPVGIVITNSAAIYFDYNDPIETDPAWWNTVAQMQAVTVYDDGGEGGGATQLIVGMPYGNALPDAPRNGKTGYAFAGWRTGPNGTGRTITAASLVQEGDSGIYASWTANEYTLTLDANGGAVSPGSKRVKYDSAIGELPTPTRTDHAFGGWYVGGTRIDSATVWSVAGDETATARWTPNGGGENPVVVVNEPVYAGTIATATGYTKAQTVDGALCKGGKIVGTVQVKFGKADKKGTVKISGTATLLEDGKAKKVTAKGVKVALDATGRVPPVALAFKDPIGDMSLEMADDGKFTLKNGTYEMAKASVGGDWSKAGAKVYVDAGGGRGATALPEGTIEELLPDGEPVIPNGGKWSFAKAVSVKYAKDKATGEYGLVIDDAKGTNRSAMKLTYTPKTGIFKGSFKLYAIQGGKLKKSTVKVIGVVVDGKGQGSAAGPNGVSFAVTVE